MSVELITTHPAASGITPGRAQAGGQRIFLKPYLGNLDIVFLTLDTLRFDVAKKCFARGETPFLARLFPAGWEPRHSPGSFTYAAHHAFFAGFLPTPVTQPWPPRLFASSFGRSRTIGPETVVFEAPEVVTGLKLAGYRTICVGGVDFFNRQSPLSRVLPDLFDEAHWFEEMSVRSRDSAERQFELAAGRLRAAPSVQKVFLFINVSAIHQPTHFYLLNAETDSSESQAAALRYVDAQLPRLLDAIERRGGAFFIACSDHGTLFGEDGLEGHRVGHPAVWTVPYAHTVIAAG